MNGNNAKNAEKMLNVASKIKPSFIKQVYKVYRTLLTTQKKVIMAISRVSILSDRLTVDAAEVTNVTFSLVSTDYSPSQSQGALT
jgi:hypothetical protein